MYSKEGFYPIIGIGEKQVNMPIEPVEAQTIKVEYVSKIPVFRSQDEQPALSQVASEKERDRLNLEVAIANAKRIVEMDDSGRGIF